MEFVPSQDQSRLMLRVQTAVGSDLTETDRAFQQVESFLLARPEVDRILAIVGGFGGSGVNSGMIFVTLKRPERARGLAGGVLRRSSARS